MQRVVQCCCLFSTECLPDSEPEPPHRLNFKSQLPPGLLLAATVIGSGCPPRPLAGHRHRAVGLMAQRRNAAAAGELGPGQLASPPTQWHSEPESEALAGCRAWAEPARGPGPAGPGPGVRARQPATVSEWARRGRRVRWDSGLPWKPRFRVGASAVPGPFTVTPVTVRLAR